MGRHAGGPRFRIRLAPLSKNRLHSTQLPFLSPALCDRRSLGSFQASSRWPQERSSSKVLSALGRVRSPAEGAHQRACIESSLHGSLNRATTGEGHRSLRVALGSVVAGPARGARARRRARPAPERHVHGDSVSPQALNPEQLQPEIGDRARPAVTRNNGDMPIAPTLGEMLVRLQLPHQQEDQRVPPRSVVVPETTPRPRVPSARWRQLAEVAHS